MKQTILTLGLFGIVLLYSCTHTTPTMVPTNEIYHVDSFNNNSVLSSNYFLNFLPNGTLVTNVFISGVDTMNYVMSSNKDTMYFSGGRSFTGVQTWCIEYKNVPSRLSQFNSRLKTITDYGTYPVLTFKLRDSL